MVTAVYDGYDTVKPVLPQRGPDGPLDVDWVFVTDREDTAAQAGAAGWRAVLHPRPGMHPNRAAKRPKFQPWKYTGERSSVWVDGSYRITSPLFAAEALALADPIAQFFHPWRDCALAEAEFSQKLPKYISEPLMEQADTYRSIGFPKGWGLWATGVIARQHTDQVMRFGDLWAVQVQRWTFQDQVSEPVALWVSGLRPANLTGDHLNNPWLVYEGSARH